MAGNAEDLRRPMGNGKHEIRIKGFSDERMDRLKKFTRSLNAELTLLGGEALDVLEAHQEYQGVIDDHEGTWADLARRLAAERTKVVYVEEDEERDEGLDGFEEDEVERAEED
jgi:hypothetical protein